MNKEYHYTISRTDRIYLISFVIILLGWELIKEILPSAEKSFIYISPPSEHHGFKVKKKFSHSKYSPFKNNTAPWSKNNERKYSTYEDELEQTPPSSPLRIMTASFDELTSMGLTKKVSANIQKFISAGGLIKNNEDLLKIYGMDSLQLMHASPFIIYDTMMAIEQSAPIATKELPLKPPLKIIDLNLATPEELESLEGIGTVLADRIIKYRNNVGGFLNPEQLKECYGMPPETFDKIKDQITISGSPHLLLINSMNLDSLKHPYLSKKQIRLITAYKKQHGQIKDVSDFRKIYPPDSNWCNKVLPYISFELNK